MAIIIIIIQDGGRPMRLTDPSCHGDFFSIFKTAAARRLRFFQSQFLTAIRSMPNFAMIGHTISELLRFFPSKMQKSTR